MGLSGFEWVLVGFTGCDSARQRSDKWRRGERGAGNGILLRRRFAGLGGESLRRPTGRYRSGRPSPFPEYETHLKQFQLSKPQHNPFRPNQTQYSPRKPSQTQSNPGKPGKTR